MDEKAEYDEEYQQLEGELASQTTRLAEGMTRLIECNNDRSSVSRADRESEGRKTALALNDTLGSAFKTVGSLAEVQSKYVGAAVRALQDVTCDAFARSLVKFDGWFKESDNGQVLIDAATVGKNVASFFNRPPILEFRPLKRKAARKREVIQKGAREVRHDDKDRPIHPTPIMKTTISTDVTGAIRRKFMLEHLPAAVRRGECAVDFVWSPIYSEMIENIYDLGFLACIGQAGAPKVGIEMRGDNLPFLTFPEENRNKIDQFMSQEKDGSDASESQAHALIWELSKEHHHALKPFYKDHEPLFTRCGPEQPNRYADVEADQDMESDADTE